MPNKKGKKKGAAMVLTSKQMIDGVLQNVEQVLKQNPSISSQNSKSKKDQKSNFNQNDEATNDISQDNSLILNQSLTNIDQINTSSVATNQDSSKNSSTRDSERVRSHSNMLQDLVIETAEQQSNLQTPQKPDEHKTDPMIFNTNEKINVITQSNQDLTDLEEDNKQIQKEVEMITPRSQSQKKFQIPSSKESSEKEETKEDNTEQQETVVQHQQDDDDDLDFMFDQDAMRAAFNEIDEKEQKQKEQEEKERQIQIQKEKNEKVKRDAEERLRREQQRIAEIKAREDEAKRVNKWQSVYQAILKQVNEGEQLIQNDKQHFALDEQNVTERIGHLDTQIKSVESISVKELEELCRPDNKDDLQDCQTLSDHRQTQLDYLEQQNNEAKSFRKQLQAEAAKRKAEAEAKQKALADAKAKADAEAAAELKRKQELALLQKEREEAEEEMAKARQAQQERERQSRELAESKKAEKELQEKKMLEEIKRREEEYEREQKKQQELKLNMERVEKQKELELQKEQEKLAQSTREEEEQRQQQKIQYTIMGIGAMVLVGGLVLFKFKK